MSGLIVDIRILLLALKNPSTVGFNIDTATPGLKSFQYWSSVIDCASVLVKIPTTSAELTIFSKKKRWKVVSTILLLPPKDWRDWNEKTCFFAGLQLSKMTSSRLRWWSPVGSIRFSIVVGWKRCALCMASGSLMLALIWHVISKTTCMAWIVSQTIL